MLSWPFCAAMCSVLSHPSKASAGDAVESIRSVFSGRDSYRAWSRGGGMDRDRTVSALFAPSYGIRDCC